MAPATKADKNGANRLQANTKSTDDFVERRIDELAYENAVRHRLMADIESRYPADGDGPPELTKVEWNFFREVEWPELRRMVFRFRQARVLREEVGDPAVLQAARQRVADATEAVRTATASLEDIQVDGATDTPLAQQIAKLTDKLRELTAAKNAAEAHLAAVVEKRQQLRGMCPPEIRQSVDQEIAALKRTHPLWRRRNELRVKIDGLTKTLAFAPGKAHGTKNPDVWRNYCRNYLPEALIVSREKYQPDKINWDRLMPHLAEVETTIIPGLIAEKDRVDAEIQAIVDDLEAPITEWMHTGEV